MPWHYYEICILDDSIPHHLRSIRLFKTKVLLSYRRGWGSFKITVIILQAAAIFLRQYAGHYSHGFLHWVLLTSWVSIIRLFAWILWLLLLNLVLMLYWRQHLLLLVSLYEHGMLLVYSVSFLVVRYHRSICLAWELILELKIGSCQREVPSRSDATFIRVVHMLERYTLLQPRVIHTNGLLCLLRR